MQLFTSFIHECVARQRETITCPCTIPYSTERFSDSTCTPLYRRRNRVAQGKRIYAFRNCWELSTPIPLLLAITVRTLKWPVQLSIYRVADMNRTAFGDEMNGKKLISIRFSTWKCKFHGLFHITQIRQDDEADDEMKHATINSLDFDVCTRYSKQKALFGRHYFFPKIGFFRSFPQSPDIRLLIIPHSFQFMLLLAFGKQ